MTAAARPGTDTRAESRRFAGFVVTGGVAAIVNVASRWALNRLMPYEAAVTLGYLLGMVTAFLLARFFVFKPAGSAWLREFGRFATVNAVSFLVVLGVSIGLARGVLPWIGWRWHPDDVAHLVAVASPIVLSYYAHKRFSFAERR